MLKKLELYKQCGIKEYWMVDSKNNLINVYFLDNRDLETPRTVGATLPYCRSPVGTLRGGAGLCPVIKGQLSASIARFLTCGSFFHF